MPDLIQAVTKDSTPPQTDRPAAERIISGDPVFTTWNIEETGEIYAGIWQSTPGKWRIIYDEWEYFHILSGVSIISDDAGVVVTLRAGDSYVIRPGFRGTWEVVETTVKDYVIRL
ncbi:MAG: cupin domain-containing protein [Yoonia sp.]|uniref:cupin domain-containing protein n=1 Tax=Yoonia sp. TaxID=2212373 RepID=UPI00273E17A4|nr:cupin domain-containing protein [Yoonia sp.]MDP5086845.1 cupin domain-containing protein [Yoonia sp.]MDP5362510.1 cupin domain-containing protein [Paracoccaceae bacterium]